MAPTRLTPVFDHLCQAASAIAILTGILVLFGWYLDVAPLKSVFSGLVAMKANTALGFILAGVSLWAAGAKRRLPRLVSKFCGGSVLVLGLSVLAEYLSGADFGIGELLVRDVTRLPGDIPGRMALSTSVCFAALGAALVLLSRERSSTAAVHALAAVPALFGGAALAGYGYETEAFLRVKLNYTPMAVHTAALFVVLALGVVFARPGYPFRRILTSDTIAGTMVRRLLPVAATLQLTMAWLLLRGLETGYLSEVVGLALFAVANSIGLSALIQWSAVRLLNAEVQRKRAEEIEDLYNRAAIGYHSVDKDGTIVRINDTELTWLGYRRDEVVGKKNFADLLTPEGVKTFRATFAASKEPGWVRDMEYELIRKDGTLLPVLLSSTAVTDAQGNFVMSRSTIVDVTERRKLEAQLKQAAAYTRSLIEASLDPLVTISADGKIMDVNQATERVTGFPRAQLIGSDFSDYFTEPDKARQGHRQVLAEGFTTDYPLAIRNLSGEITDVLYNATVFRNEAGEVQGVFAAARDITERKRAEKQMTERMKELRAFFHISELAARKEFTLDNFHQLVNVLPESWQYPEITGARIVIDGREFRTSNFKASEWMQTAPVKAFGAVIGRVEIAYLEQKPEEDEGPFFKEERLLIDAIAERVGHITERKRVEESLRFQADQYATLLTTTFDGYWRCTVDGRLLDVNDAYCRMSGYSREELITLHIAQIEAVETPEDVARHTQFVSKTGFDRFESRHRKKDGELWDVEVSVSLWRRTGELLVFLRDITERKRNEAVSALRLHLVQFAQSHSLDELLEETLNGAERLTGSVIGFYHFVEEDQNALTLQAWSTRTKAVFCKAVGKGLHYPISEAGVWADCVRQGRPVIHNDYASLPNRKGMPEGHAPVIRELVVPVRRAQKVVAALGVGNKPTEYMQRDVETALLIADLTEEIAARKRAEEAEREASLYASSLIEASLDPLITISAEGKVMDANQAAERVTGHSRAQLIGSDFSGYFTEPEKARQGYQQVLAEGFVKDYPLSIRNISGEVTDVLFNATVFRNEAGEVQGVFADARDITERKRAAEALERSERLLRTILENLPVGVFLHDGEGRVVETNPAMERIWGAAPRVGIEEYHKYKGWRAETGERIEPHAWPSARAVERGETTLNQVIDIERSDGVRHTILNSSVPVRDAQGRIIGAVTVNQDITELRQAERALRALNARLEQAMAELVATQQQVIQSEKLAAVGTLAAGVAHELNNPLMGVMGYVGMAQRREQSRELREMLGNAFHELQRMRDLIKNLLGFARPVVEGELSPVNVQATLERAIALLQSDFRARAVTVTASFAPELPMVLAKPNELQQVFVNLLMNARDAVEDRAEKQVRISAHRTDNKVLVEIADTGPGIPSEIQGRIFDPFVTTKPPGKGTGLGLSVARSIMADLGGALTVDSRVGEGATFTVVLALPQNEGKE